MTFDMQCMMARSRNKAFWLGTVRHIRTYTLASHWQGAE
jgi:hypothetical protein